MPTPSDPNRICTATSSQTGRPCRAAAILGGTVCSAHGGRAPQVKAAAQRRLAEVAAARTLAQTSVRPIGDPIVELADVAGQALALLEWALGHASTGDLPSDEWLLRVERNMDRAGRLLEACGRLGLEERRVKLEEAKLDLLARVMVEFLSRRGIDANLPDVQADLDAVYREIGEGS